MHVSHLKTMDWRSKLWWSVCWKVFLSYYSHDWAVSYVNMFSLLENKMSVMVILK